MGIRRAVWLTAAIFLLTSFLNGQSRSAILQGTVSDPSLAPVSGAQITVTRSGRETGISGASDESGRFSLAVEPGKYVLKISAKGFSEFSQSFEIAGGVEERAVVLELAGITDTVTVTEPLDYRVGAISSSTRTVTALRDVPQSIAVVTQEQVRDQILTSIGDVVRYIPGIMAHQGENNRDQVVIRGNSSSADFFVNGVRDDVQYYRDLYNLDRLEALRGPNALTFGRGGGGGVINRVTKQAGFMPIRELTLQGGSYNNKRVAFDAGQVLNNRFALRLNAMFEDSGSFRDYVNLRRHGINPSVTIVPGKATTIMATYENFRDKRKADRGITSFQGRPADVPISTYFGNPEDSHVRADVNLGSVTVEHQARAWTIRNRMHIGSYDRDYQNYVPGVVSADKAEVSVSAYNNATRRLNVFNQTDLVYTGATKGIRHVLVGGGEVGSQLTDNFRNTGYFDNTSTSIRLPYSRPLSNAPVTFRQSASDADNHVELNLAAAYVQDQIEFSRHVQVITGVRFDRFDLRYHNNRTDETLQRIDNLASPRAGLVIKPFSAASIYGSYTISYLPGSGDQFSSLTSVTQQVKPEKFSNYELGFKWDVHRSLSVTSAVYRLNRTNTRATDPNDPARIVQTGSQRTNGYEAGVNGSITRSWKVAGGYSWQDAFITSATVNARAGAQVAQVPHHTFSLWSNYGITRRAGAGLGIVRRTAMYAAVDNTVVLPGYTRADAALFFSVSEGTRVQANLENVFNRKYYVNADSNTNISPGLPRALRVAVITRF